MSFPPSRRALLATAGRKDRSSRPSIGGRGLAHKRRVASDPRPGRMVERAQVLRAHDQTYETDKGQKVKVDFDEACNLHEPGHPSCCPDSSRIDTATTAAQRHQAPRRERACRRST